LEGLSEKGNLGSELAQRACVATGNLGGPLTIRRPVAEKKSNSPWDWGKGGKGPAGGFRALEGINSGGKKKGFQRGGEGACFELNFRKTQDPAKGRWGRRFH